MRSDRTAWRWNKAYDSPRATLRSPEAVREATTKLTAADVSGIAIDAPDIYYDGKIGIVIREQGLIDCILRTLRKMPERPDGVALSNMTESIEIRLARTAASYWFQLSVDDAATIFRPAYEEMFDRIAIMLASGIRDAAAKAAPDVVSLAVVTDPQSSLRIVGEPAVQQVVNDLSSIGKDYTFVGRRAAIGVVVNLGNGDAVHFRLKPDIAALGDGPLDRVLRSAASLRM